MTDLIPVGRVFRTVAVICLARGIGVLLFGGLRLIIAVRVYPLR